MKYTCNNNEDWQIKKIILYFVLQTVIFACQGKLIVQVVMTF